MNTVIDELNYKLYNIRTMNWIKCDYNGSGCIGMQLEKLLNKNLDKKILPDYKGIEIKTKCVSKNMDKYGVSLFSSSFDDYPLSMKKFFDIVSYPDNKLNINKFQKRINTFKGLIINNYYIKIYTDNKNEKLKIFIINRNYHKIISTHSWSYKELEARLSTKLKYMVLVYARLYTIGDTKFIKYDDYHFYKLKGFNNFLYCLKKGYIIVNFNLLERKDSNSLYIFDKGTSFEIETKYINELFEEIKKDN